MITAVVLAGGLGTRLRSVVSDVPKPMAEIAGKPFLAHLMDYWISQGVTKFILSVGYKSEIIMNHFGDSYGECPITYAIESTPMGTGGGLINAMMKLPNDDSFLLLNGDTFFEVDLRKLIEFHNKSCSDCTFTLFRSEESGRYMGISIDNIGRILSLRSEKGQVGDLANGGVYILNPSIIRHYGDNYLGKESSLESDIFLDMFNGKKNIFGLEFLGRFIDIGIPRDYLDAYNYICR